MGSVFSWDLHVSNLSGTGDAQLRFARIYSRESFAIETLIFIAHQADSRESLEFPIRANHATESRIAVRGLHRFESPSVRSDLKSHEFELHSNRCSGFTLFETLKIGFKSRDSIR